MIEDIYFRTADTLLKAHEKGHDKAFFSPDWTMKDNALVTRVQNNIFAFSGAKCYSEMKELREAMYEGGNLLPKADFRRRARKINQTYNETYLDVERDQVMSAATQGSRWLDIEESRDTHPYLEYVTMADERVREEHQGLHGIILPVDDPFWNSYYPPNGYRCRCSTRKRTEREYNRKAAHYTLSGDSLLDSEAAQKKAGKVVAKPFRHNVGTSEVFERDGHPYFKANKDAKEQQLSAVKNYGMKSVKDVYKGENRLSRYKASITDETGFNAYWDSLVQKYEGKDGGFTIIDKKNRISAHFDRDLKEKIIHRERHLYFDEVERLINDPHEVWGTFKASKTFKEEFFNVYIRYYEDRPIVALVNQDGRVDSFYRLDTLQQCEDFRRGLLKKKR